jgi:hypothetical protein
VAEQADAAEMEWLELAELAVPPEMSDLSLNAFSDEHCDVYSDVWYEPVAP